MQYSTDSLVNTLTRNLSSVFTAAPAAAYGSRNTNTALLRTQNEKGNTGLCLPAQGCGLPLLLYHRSCLQVAYPKVKGGMGATQQGVPYVGDYIYHTPPD